MDYKDKEENHILETMKVKAVFLLCYFCAIFSSLGYDVLWRLSNSNDIYLSRGC